MRSTAPPRPSPRSSRPMRGRRSPLSNGRPCRVRWTACTPPVQMPASSPPDWGTRRAKPLGSPRPRRMSPRASPLPRVLPTRSRPRARSLPRRRRMSLGPPRAWGTRSMAPGRMRRRLPRRWPRCMPSSPVRRPPRRRAVRPFRSRPRCRVWAAASPRSAFSWGRRAPWARGPRASPGEPPRLARRSPRSPRRRVASPPASPLSGKRFREWARGRPVSVRASRPWRRRRASSVRARARSGARPRRSWMRLRSRETPWRITRPLVRSAPRWPRARSPSRPCASTGSKGPSVRSPRPSPRWRLVRGPCSRSPCCPPWIPARSSPAALCGRWPSPSPATRCSA